MSENDEKKALIQEKYSSSFSLNTLSIM